MSIKIGTRGSKLALWQAYHVQDLLKAHGAESEIVTIETKGDKVLDVTIAKIGSKGVFTEEIEEQLRDGRIDIAVHSAKDMQSTLPEGFELIAFGEREKSHDVLVSHQSIDLKQKNLVLGTSSTRRLAFLQKYYPHIKTVPVRGNLQTRIQKMKDGACDALWLAYAGAHRMAFDDMIVHEFDPVQFVPAVGQGSIAIEVNQSLEQSKKDLVRKAVNHEPSEKCLLAERAFLKKMDGGCSIPVFGLATIENEVLSLSGGIISLDGQTTIEKTCCSTTNAAQKVGETLADFVLENGGREILEDIRKQQAE
ncbi:hydroxymethylbilane synthase [Reichenbachiella carrageenanivorans]|uniref:Hydroxymethylbilane synthase n=1 Tax=Reichenbachiella carrageenanivorans TaxID=2979869 RepID=A0ABY6D3U7_9BACT|nr:hydroxymethylbilane synthase [Reichenbachiella carrageenanivorans]UXX80295.1 hydroxymethylbilane synthase [Reichenbachiella carrageenanivorans]